MLGVPDVLARRAWSAVHGRRRSILRLRQLLLDRLRQEGSIGRTASVLSEMARSPPAATHDDGRENRPRAPIGVRGATAWDRRQGSRWGAKPRSRLGDASPVTGRTIPGMGCRARRRVGRRPLTDSSRARLSEQPRCTRPCLVVQQDGDRRTARARCRRSGRPHQTRHLVASSRPRAEQWSHALVAFATEPVKLSSNICLTDV